MSKVVARHWRAFLVAVQFLTIIPTPRTLDVTEDIQGLSLQWYPLVGLLIGVSLTLVFSVLQLPFYLMAALLLVGWVLLTGGLHLDGLADCADAWVGGMGDRERTLELLKDPLCGSMGVIALVCLLLLKGAALAAVIQTGQMIWLWTVPLLARASLLLLFSTTDYVRPQGLGDILSRYFSRSRALGVVCAIGLLLLMVLPLSLWCALVTVLLLIVAALRRVSLHSLGGFTGDVAGAQVELVELGLLLTLACSAAV